MSDVMLHGVLNIPPDLWRDDEIDKQQRYSRYLEASKKLYKYEAALEQITKDCTARKAVMIAKKALSEQVF